MFPTVPSLAGPAFEAGGWTAEGVSRTRDQHVLIRSPWLLVSLSWLTGVLYLASALFQVPESLLGEPNESWALDSYQSRLPASLAFQLRKLKSCTVLVTDFTLSGENFPDSDHLPVPGNPVYL